MIRRNLRQPASRLDEFVEHGREPISDQPSPDQQAQQDWDTSVLKTAMEELKQYVSERTFQAFYLRTIKDLSEAETAEALGLTAEQVRYRKHRAQKKLKSIVAVYTGEPIS
jgi:RNA polymerase sigma factor (sigma-70 family)